MADDIIKQVLEMEKKINELEKELAEKKIEIDNLKLKNKILEDNNQELLNKNEFHIQELYKLKQYLKKEKEAFVLKEKEIIELISKMKKIIQREMGKNKNDNNEILNICKKKYSILLITMKNDFEVKINEIKDSFKKLIKASSDIKLNLKSDKSTITVNDINFIFNNISKMQNIIIKSKNNDLIKNIQNSFSLISKIKGNMFEVSVKDFNAMIQNLENIKNILKHENELINMKLYEIKEFDPNSILELIDSSFLRLKKFEFLNNSLKIDDIIDSFKDYNINQIENSLKNIEQDIDEINKNSQNTKSKEELEKKLNIFESSYLQNLETELKTKAKELLEEKTIEYEEIINSLVDDICANEHKNIDSMLDLCKIEEENSLIEKYKGKRKPDFDDDYFKKASESRYSKDINERALNSKIILDNNKIKEIDIRKDLSLKISKFSEEVLCDTFYKFTKSSFSLVDDILNEKYEKKIKVDIQFFFDNFIKDKIDWIFIEKTNYIIKNDLEFGSLFIIDPQNENQIEEIENSKKIRNKFENLIYDITGKSIWEYIFNKYKQNFHKNCVNCFLS